MTTSPLVAPRDPASLTARWLLPFACAMAFLGGGISFGQVLTPSSGPVGTQVVVALNGMDSNAVTGAKLGNTTASIVTRGPGTVTITVPGGGSSNPVTLFLGEDTRVTPISFEVTRLVPVAVAANYPAVDVVGSLFGNAATGQVEVALGRPSLVFASDGGDGPVLLAIVTDADSAIRLDAASTARATLFLSSLIHTADSAEGAARLQILAGLGEVTALASYLDAEVQAGNDYSETSTFRAHLEAALTAYLAEPEPGAPGAMEGGASTSGGYLTRDLIVESKLDRILPTTYRETLRAGTGQPVVAQKFGPAPLPDVDLGKLIRANPLEWSANLYALNVADVRLNTRQKALALPGSYSAIYNRIAPQPYDYVVVPSKAATGNLNALGLIQDWLGAAVLGLGEGADPTLKSELLIPDDAPGLYMVRAFSGARFDRQEALIDNLPGGTVIDTQIFTLNVVCAVNETLAVLIAHEKYFSSAERAEFLAKLYGNIIQAISMAEVQGRLDADAVKAIFLASAKNTLDFAAERLVKGGLTALPSRLGGVLVGLVDVSYKVSVTARVVERMNALSNAVQVFNDNAYTIQAVEDTLIIVGDPWAPQISGFQPKTGRRGSAVTITGTGFSNTLADNIVTFGYNGTSPDNPPVAAIAPVIQKSGNNLLVAVPEEAGTGVISVQVVDKGRATTASLDPPFQQFVVIPDPMLIAMDPPAARPGQIVKLIGENFPPVSSNPADPQLFAYFDVGGEMQRFPIAGSATELTVKAGSTVGSGTVRLRYFQTGSPVRESNAIGITILPSAVPPMGAEIQFAASPDNNVRDDRITLREALMLKNGTLSYASLTSPPDPRPPGVTYETDFISSDDVGTEFRNRLVGQYHAGTTISLTSPLPPVANWTVLDGNAAILQGNGVATGLVLDNAKGVTLTEFTLKNFSSAAILITGGSQENVVDFCTVEGGAGHGVHLLDNAKINLLFVRVYDVQGDGFRLSGLNVVGNDITVMDAPTGRVSAIENCGGWGIRIENGAYFNRVLAPIDPLFGAPPSGGITGNTLGGILVTGNESVGNSIHQMQSVGLPIDLNGGPGIRIESPETSVSLCRLTRNNGSGIEIAGVAAAGSRVEGCTIGYAWQNGFPFGNASHGIHITDTSEIEVGKRVDWNPGNAVPFNGIGDNTGHGILIENSNDIAVRTTLIGRVPRSDSLTEFYDLPNEMSGVVLQNSSDCTLGNNWFRARLQITGHLNGTGLVLTGAQTKNNTVVGTLLGFDSFDADTDLGNNIGLEVLDNAWDNRIGMHGASVNDIRYNRLAGVVIDAGLDPTQTIPLGGEPFAPEGGNVVVNNRIQQQHDVGVLLKSNAKGVRVGGAVPGDSNTISGNGKISLKIEGATAPDLRPELGNRVMGNSMFGHGFVLAEADPLGGVPEGVGILVLDSENQRIGGDRVAEGNTMGNGWVGVMVFGGEGNFVGNNKIGSMRKAGILLRDTRRTTAGPNNEITGSGVAGFGPLGGLVIAEGHGHDVIGNRIGTFRNGAAGGILGDGVLIKDSWGNEIGGHGHRGNVINNASLHGVRVTGIGSTDNFISGNKIGVTPGPGPIVQPNAGGGIVLEAGASENTIGGTIAVFVNGAAADLPAGNAIERNNGDGVRVEGGGTFSNTITYNRITANAGVGIALAGGNNNLPAPNLTPPSPPFRVINGTSPAANGSLVQVFQDDDGEGKVLIGETVVQGGAFQFEVPFLMAINPLVSVSEVTATVTNAATGDTSPFASPVIVPANPLQLSVARFGPGPVPRSAAPASPVLVMPLVLDVNGEEAVRVTRLKFDFTGTAASAVSQASLYRDNNKNGIVDSGDVRVGAILTDISLDAEFTGSLAVVQPDEMSRLLLDLTIAPGAANGQEIEFRLVSAAGVSATALLGPTPVDVTGVLPAISDRITVNQAYSPNNFSGWASQYFTLQELTGIGAPTSDAEGDAQTNLFEYFAGTHPRSGNGWPFLISTVAGNGQFTFTHFNRPDLTWLVEESSNLTTWGPLTLGTLLPPEMLGDGRVRETVSHSLSPPQLFFRLRVSLISP